MVAAVVQSVVVVEYCEEQNNYITMCVYGGVRGTFYHIHLYSVSGCRWQSFY